MHNCFGRPDDIRALSMMETAALAGCGFPQVTAVPFTHRRRPHRPSAAGRPAWQSHRLGQFGQDDAATGPRASGPCGSGPPLVMAMPSTVSLAKGWSSSWRSRRARQPGLHYLGQRGDQPVASCCGDDRPLASIDLAAASSSPFNRSARRCVPAPARIAFSANGMSPLTAGCLLWSPAAGDEV